MKKHFLGLFALVLAVVLTAFTTKGLIAEEKIRLSKIKYDKKSINLSWVAFEYIGGPHDNPLSYIKILPEQTSITNYCPGNNSLCAILAEEDFYFNPGHPTQSSLDFLLVYYGCWFYFPFEVPGLVEFKTDDQ